MKKCIEGFVKFKIVIIMLISIIVAVAGVCWVNKDARKIPSSQKTNESLSLDSAEIHGFAKSNDGLVLEEDVSKENTDGPVRDSLVYNMGQTISGLTSGEDKVDFEQYPYIILDNNDYFLHKLKYEYESNGRVETIILTYNEENGSKTIVGTYEDYNNQFTDASVHYIGASCTKVMIVFMVAKDLTVKNVVRYNDVTINWMYFFVIFFAIFSVLFTLVSVKWAECKPENIFVVLALLLGFSYMIIIPIQKTGWDESFHFEQAYRLFPHNHVGNVVDTYMNDKLVWPLNQPQTYEEYEIQNAYVNEHAIGDEKISSHVTLANVVGYGVPAIGIEIASILKLPFTEAYRFGKIFYLILYIIIIYLAIKRMKTGKILMMLLALMPTCIYMACIYNRDSVMIACSFLATAYLFSVFYEKDRKITWKDFGIIMASLFVVCLLKAIYAPMILMVLLLPKTKFENKKTRWFMYLGTIGVCVLLVATIIIPILLHAGEHGDTRGAEIAGAGAVINVAQQMQYIFANLMTYMKLLVKTIVDYFVDYSVGYDMWGTLGHYSPMGRMELLSPFIMVLAVIDVDKDQENIAVYRKIGILALLAVCVAFVWTTMYLSFTAVGGNVIQGVQARYFFPIIMPFFLLLNTAKIRNEIKPSSYMKAFISIMLILQYCSIYKVIMKPFCM